ncbi:MAG: hypothetical protein VW362_05740 [Candidatus Nanopelagicales bacterium]
MIAALVDGLTLTDIVLILGFAAVILDRVADSRGWSRSSKTLRRENEDLVRRNTELEQTVARHEDKIRTLEQKVVELEKRDQAAVLRAIEQHETKADARHAKTLDVLVEIRDTLQEGATP